MGYPSVLSRQDLGLLRRARSRATPFKFQRPYGSYVMEHVLFKISFPAEFHSQTAVEAAMTIHEQLQGRRTGGGHREDHDPHARGVHPHHRQEGPAQQPGRPRPLHPVHGRRAGLIFGRLTAEDYEDEVAADPRIDALRDKIVCVEDKQFTKDYHDPEKRSIANAFTVEFKDGKKTEGSGGRVPDRPQPPPQGRHAGAGREVQDATWRARSPPSSSRADLRSLPGCQAARVDAGERVRRPDGDLTELSLSDSVLMKGTARPSVRCRAAAILTIARLHPALESSNLPGMPTKSKPSVSKSAQKPPQSKAASLIVSSSHPARRAGRGGK